MAQAAAPPPASPSRFAAAHSATRAFFSSSSAAGRSPDLPLATASSPQQVRAVYTSTLRVQAVGYAPPQMVMVRAPPVSSPPQVRTFASPPTTPRGEHNQDQPGWFSQAPALATQGLSVFVGAVSAVGTLAVAIPFAAASAALSSGSGGNVAPTTPNKQQQQQQHASSVAMHAPPVQLKRRKQSHSVVPLGSLWFELTNDFAEADGLPRSIALDPCALVEWEALKVHSNFSDIFSKHEGFVETLVKSGRVSASMMSQIDRDLPRTFPDEDLFSDPDVVDSMRRILVAIVVEYPMLGYVQSMNFVCAFLLLHCKSEDAAFCLFRRLLDHPRLMLQQMYCDGFPLLRRLMSALDMLIASHFPQAHAHLKRLGIDTMMWAQTNAMTLFTYSMDWSTVSIIWTHFLQRGWDPILKVFLFILKWCEARIMASDDFEGAISALRDASGQDALADIMSRASRQIVFSEDDEHIVSLVYL